MSDPTAADVIFAGGRIWTGSPSARRVVAVAVRDGLIVAAGSATEVGAWKGPRTERIDLGAGLLLPAFQDSHSHPLMGGLAALACDLTGSKDPATWLATVERYARAHPELDVITGEGWDPYAFEGWPTRELLDAVVADRPVVLTSRDGHSTWANTRALERAGIGDDVTDPPRGHIERDHQGIPTGVFHESASDLVDWIVPRPGAELRARALLHGQAYLQRLGISAWLDAIVDPDDEATYLDVWRSGRLSGRVMLALRWDPDRGMEQISELQDRRRTIESEAGSQLQARAVKLFLDGVVESETAALLAPYRAGGDSDPLHAGTPVYESGALAAIAVALHQADFDLHMHAIGDGAVRMALDAVQAAREAGPARDARHTIAHLELVDQHDIERFAKLEAIAACQPLWAVHDETDVILSQRLDPGRLERRFPFGRLRDAGATLAFGSDWNVTSADPLRILHVATWRTPPDRPEAPPLGPARERLTLEEGLQAYIAGSARVNRLEAISGGIAVGRAADLIVLDHDPLPGDVPLSDCQVRLTMVGGAIVHAS